MIQNLPQSLSTFVQNILRMKNLIILFALSIGIVSCKKVDEFTMFNIESDTESVIESQIGINLPFTLPTPVITTNIEQEMEENNSRKDLIEYANLHELRLSIKSPESANFDFLNDLDIYINADGLTEMKIAEIHDLPENGATSISLEVIQNLDIQNYIKADKYYLNMVVKTDQVVLHDVTLAIHSNVFVDAKILGL